MDPKAALAGLVAAIEEADYEKVTDYAEALDEWLGKKGAVPVVTSEQLRIISMACLWWANEERRKLEKE